MKKQKIEDIFSSIEDFSKVPPPEFWAEIEEKLDQPKKKKRVILWWSAAACLLLGLLLPSILHFTASPENNNINNGGFDTNKVVLENKTNHTNPDKSVQNKENSDAAVDSSTAISASENQLNNSESIQNQKTAVANAKNNTAKKDAEFNPGTQNNSPNQSESFASIDENSNTKKENKSNLAKHKKDKNHILSEERIAFGKASKFNSTAKKQLSNSIFEQQFAPKNSSNSFAFNNQSSASTVNSTAKQASGKLPNENTSTEIAYKSDSKENNKFNSNALSKIDSVQLAELQNLERGITPEAKKEEKDKKDKSINKKEKWAVAVFAGVASSENTKNEKTLGNVNDSKQSNTFGVKTKYSINKKWAVGSGFKINELGQSVANVSYVNAKSNAFFTPTGSHSESIAQISSSADYLLVSNNTKDALKNENIQNGSLDQSLKYIEMPLEVSYSVFNKNKTSINLNTGGFVGKLISNNVALDGHSIGENVNANDFVYGSTLSSTVQYRVYKKTNVFVEPAMNYYINPLNSQSFNQFQWGLNFGLNVSF